MLLTFFQSRFLAKIHAEKEKNPFCEPLKFASAKKCRNLANNIASGSKKFVVFGHARESKTHGDVIKREKVRDV